MSYALDLRENFEKVVFTVNNIYTRYMSEPLKSKTFKPAAFFDRDGVICEFVDELAKLEEFKFRPGIVEAIRRLNKANYWVFVATNQPNIAKEKMTWAELEEIHQYMCEELLKLGARIDHVYFCPHRDIGTLKEFSFDCECRKPKPGMLEQAAKDFPILKERSFMVGDTWRDVECAKNFGIKSVAVTGGGGYPYLPNSSESKSKPDHLCENPLAAIEWWLAQER